MSDQSQNRPPETDLPEAIEMILINQRGEQQVAGKVEGCSGEVSDTHYYYG
jgi:hypothetical protein